MPTGSGGAAARLYVSVGADVKGAVAGLRSADAQFKKTTASARAMDAQMRRSSSTARGTRVAYSGLGTTVAQANKEQIKAAPATEKTTRATSRLGKAAKSTAGNLSSAATGLTGTQVAAVGAAYAFGKSVKNAADFDSAMRNVNSIAGLSEGNFQRLKSSVLGLSGPTAQAPNVLADGMYQLVSSGFKAGDALKVLKSSAIAATAGMTDSATATTAVAGVINAYKLSAKDAAQVSDDLFQTVNLGVLSFEDLAQGIGPVLPFASRLGVDLKQVGAMTATLTKAGIPAAESFAYMKGAMAQLVKPSTALKDQFKALGVESGGELVRKTGSLQSALEALYQSVGENDRRFADLFPDIRGMSAAFTATGKGAASAKQDLKAFADTAGITSRVFKEQSKGQGFVWKQLGADIKQASIDLGNNFAPEIKVAGNALHGFFGLLHRNKSTVGTVLKGLASPISLPIKGISSLANKGAGGAGLKQVKPVTLRVDDKQASRAIANTKKGLGQIPGIKNVKVKVQSDADVVATRTRTALTRSAKPIKIKTEFDRAGNAATVVSAVKPKPVKIPVKVDTAGATKGASQVKAHLDAIKPKKTKIDADASGAKSAASQAQQFINSVHGKTVQINVVTKKSSKAKGGYTDTGLVEVNERGPEAATYPDGTTAMLGDGKRGIHALPLGTYVHTASATRQMQHLAGGGSVGRKGSKLSEKERERRQRARERKARRIERHNERIESRSRVKDLKAQKRAVSKDETEQANIDLAIGQRHLAEAKKRRGRGRAEAIAQAQLEIEQAKKRQADAALAAQEKANDLLQKDIDARNANTAAIQDLGKQISESTRVANTTRTVTRSQIERGIVDVFSNGMGGRLGATQRTLGPAASY